MNLPENTSIENDKKINLTALKTFNTRLLTFRRFNLQETILQCEIFSNCTTSEAAWFHIQKYRLTELCHAVEFRRRSRGQKIKPWVKKWRNEITWNQTVAAFLEYVRINKNKLPKKIFLPPKSKRSLRTLSYLVVLLVGFFLVVVEINVLDGFRDLANFVTFDYIVVYTKHDELRRYYLLKTRR